jgi:hypothetical protein
MKNGNDVMPYMRIGSSAKNIQEKNNVCYNLKQAKALQQVSSVPLWLKSLTSSVVMREHPGLYIALSYLQTNICLATGDCKLAAVSYDALKSLHKTLLQKLVPSNEAINKERSTQPNGFRFSNLELDLNDVPNSDSLSQRISLNVSCPPPWKK